MGAAVTFRPATRAEVPAIIALFIDDPLGRTRESDDARAYQAAFDAIAQEPANHLIVGVDPAGQVIAHYQITFIHGLSLTASRRAQVEGVRVATHLRGRGIGRAMFTDADTRARAAGCTLMQLTMNTTRTDSHRFYESLGYVPSHVGFKRALD